MAKSDREKAATCRSCGSESYWKFLTATIKSSGAELQYWLCPVCGLVFHDAIIPPDYYRERYRTETNGQPGPTLKELEHQAHRVRALAPYLRGYIKPGTFALDVGSSAGLLLEAMRAWGAEMTRGVEPGDAYRVYQQGRGLIVFGDLEFFSAKFDLITCIHTLEHVVDPGKMLHRLREAAAPGALLMVEVPHALLSPAGPSLAHPCLFTPDSLAPLLLCNGWKPIWIIPHIGTANALFLPSNILALCEATDAVDAPWIAPDYERAINEFLLCYQVQTGKVAEGVKP